MKVAIILEFHLGFGFLFRKTGKARQEFRKR